MKLHTLHENKADQLSISVFTENLHPDDAQAIKDFLALFKDYSVKTSDIWSEEMFIHIGNGLVEFDFSFSKEAAEEENMKSYYPIVEVANMINSKYIHEVDKITEGESYKMALLDSYVREYSLDAGGVNQGKEKDRTLKHMQHWLKAADEFTEWYFDLTQEHGKVKLMKTTFDPRDGSSRQRWIWVPVIGFFSAEASLTSNIEKGVF